MPNLPISDLPSASVPFTGEELVPIVQDGVTVKTTLSELGVVPATSGGVFFEDPQDFLAQYIPPPNARFLYIFMCGGGGGGGGAGWGNYGTDTIVYGGGGGSGGLRKEFWLPLEPRPTMLNITVGEGGFGGPAGDSTSGGGFAGSAGYPSQVFVDYPGIGSVTILTGWGDAGNAGAPDPVFEPPLGGYPVVAQPFVSYVGPYEPAAGNVVPVYNITSGGGGQNTPNLSTLIWKGGSVVSAYHPSGGGGGGSIDFGNAVESGDGGDSSTPLVSISGGVGTDSENINGKDGNSSVASTTNDFQFNAYPSWLPICGTGGSGGGASSFAHSAGNGGNGYRGGGGGGGGAFSNKTNPDGLAGNGGNGGNGYVIIYEFY